MKIRRKAQAGLTAVELDRGDALAFELDDGAVREIELLDTGAKILFTTLRETKVEEIGARTFYEFTCCLRVDGAEHMLRREVPTQASFYEPWEFGGVRLWFDAVQDIFEFLTETHGACRPRKHARFALQDARRSICPEPVHPWCPIREGRLDILDCYLGEDCWLGPYMGASAHGGLDINHPPGVPLWAPVGIDDHFFVKLVERGDKNNRWRGLRRWPDGSAWILECAHLPGLLVPEHQALAAGAQFATGAGVSSGYHHHSHFNFAVERDGEEIQLDPWILFWQTYQDLKARRIPNLDPRHTYRWCEDLRRMVGEGRPPAP